MGDFEYTLNREVILAKQSLTRSIMRDNFSLQTIIEGYAKELVDRVNGRSSADRKGANYWQDKLAEFKAAKQKALAPQK